MSFALLWGADDYVVLGLEDAQLVSRAIARLSVKLRHERRAAWQLGPYVLDVSQGTLSSEIALVRLTPREQMLALLLVQNRGHLVPQARLCLTLCGETGPTAERALKQTISVLDECNSKHLTLHLGYQLLDRQSVSNLDTVTR